MNAATPRVSIGLPVYNGSPFLAQAIDSLLGQTFTDFELIISDNASTDATRAICLARAGRDPRVRYSRRDTNEGATRNFNRVFELARAPYFKWAADDDVHEPTYLERCVAVLDRDPGVVLAHARIADIDAGGQRRPADELKLNWASPRPHRRFRAAANPHHRCESIFGVVRAEALRATRLLSDFAGCDRVLLAELALMGRFHDVDDVLFLHREHPRRSTRQYRSEQTRTAWFNPARAGQPVFPHVSMMRGYARAIRAADVPWVDKVVCRMMLLPWAIRNRRGLGQDVAFALSCRMATRDGRAAVHEPTPPEYAQE